ncbi:cation:proton antiporter [Acuticoccus sp. MNP-M23]|uniref:cation:proton antiporter n=1 Tax=Acuticoccus sp. MNP-M23 TaxID=3072793 RepID=UPI002816701D|nr:cation:proton antiporter [Acuticoccus sp. MNP-M23]WMS41504.1 cation:proton antiporter [Acuticoccus sp. MNP-M23]
MSDSFFGLDPYHVLIAAVGGVVILAYWLPRFASSREPAASGLLIVMAALVFSLLPGMPAALDPRESPKVWELASEIAVIAALFGTGIKIDNIRSLSRWRPTIMLLAVAMPLTILAVALLGHYMAGLTIAGAILLGAVLSPTDPVLAGDVQVGPPLAGGEHRVRFTLTAEAGLNDGLAFPFVYLGLIVAAQGFDPSAWGLEWLGRDVIYRIGVGSLLGAGFGWLLGQVLFIVPRKAPLADTVSGIVALAGVLLCYGGTELAEGYGFIAVFVMGLTLRRIERGHDFHRRLHDFTEAIEHAITAIILVGLGAAIPILFQDLTLVHVVIAVLLIFVVRPAAGWLSLAGTNVGGRNRAVIAIYGVRGVGSVYYLAYAQSHIEFVNEPQLWALVAFVILLSTMVHGLTAGMAMERIGPDGDER